jgi:hypothetical protein
MIFSSSPFAASPLAPSCAFRCFRVQSVGYRGRQRNPPTTSHASTRRPSAESSLCLMSSQKLCIASARKANPPPHCTPTGPKANHAFGSKKTAILASSRVRSIAFLELLYSFYGGSSSFFDPTSEVKLKETSNIYRYLV